MIGAPPPPSWRKPAGVFVMIGLIATLAALVGTLSRCLTMLPMAVQLIAYCVLGIVWILPLGPLLRWMESGRWK
ncbi:MAG: DUF2842 domain-containing protein [Alphaproteobacteria bacterium]|nr:DUF2842 domain-containing protein [Alphaproteobacteria bacterium]MDE2340640.1 DUF2842 domain-containing protein [Alphaproteobacteria bacterium]